MPVLVIMNKKTLIVLLLIIVTLANKANALGYVPKKGEIIMFYPVVEKIKALTGGYDCFYDADKVLKNGKVKAKDEYRFMPSENGLTPFSEIEGHKFKMIYNDIENENKKIDKKFFIILFEREDNRQVLLRLPAKRRKETSCLTQSMVLHFNKNEEHTYALSIPCCPIKKFNYIKDNFEGDTIVNYNRTSNKQIKEYDLLMSHVKYMGGYFSERFTQKMGYQFVCDSIAFRNIKTLHYKQPIAFCRYGELFVRIPLFEFRSAGGMIYGEGYDMSKMFEKKSDLFNHLLRIENTNDSIFKIVGKKIHVTDERTLVKEFNFKNCAYNSDDLSKYNIEPDSVYYCEKIDIYSPDIDWYLCLAAYMKDSRGNHFQIRLRDFSFIRETFYSFIIFELEDDHIRRLKEWEKREKEQKAKYDSIYNYYKNKYGDDVAETLTYDNCSEERYLKLKKKYGYKKALNMCKRRLQIGWTFDEVKEAIENRHIEYLRTAKFGNHYQEWYLYLPNYSSKIGGKILIFINDELYGIYDNDE